MEKDWNFIINDIPILEGELEWIISVLDSTEETITGVLRYISLKHNTSKGGRFKVVLVSNLN